MALLSLAARPFAFGQSYYLDTDVPSTLGGADYTTDELVLSDNFDGTNFAMLLDVAISPSPGQIGYRFGIQPREVWEECPPEL